MRTPADHATKRRGQVWLAELGGREKTRPVVLVSRDEAYLYRRQVTVAHVTSRARVLPSHVLLEDSGVSGLHGSVNCDQLVTIDQGRLVDLLGTLAPRIVVELDAALSFALELR